VCVHEINFIEVRTPEATPGREGIKYTRQSFTINAVSCRASISDRTDLSTESGSVPLPIQLAWVRGQTEHRSVAKSPPYCMTWPLRE